MSGFGASLLYVLFATQWGMLLLLGALILGAFNQIGHLQQELQRLTPTPSHLRTGDGLPADLGLTLPPRTFVAMMMCRGCSGCTDLCRRFAEVDLGEWHLVTVLFGTAEEADLPLPAYAQPLYDPARRWGRELGVKSTPTVLAFADGRLVDQQIAPNVAWLTTVIQQSAGRDKEVLGRTA